MGDKKNDNSWILDPPLEILQDPIYREAHAKEWAKYVFDQRLLHSKNELNIDSDFKGSSLGLIKEAAINAGKSLIILNGAAAVAILTKVGTGHDLTTVLQIYSWGASTGALVLALTYLSQYFYHYGNNNLGLFFQICGISSFAMGFVLFIFGGYSTASALGYIVSGCPF